MKSPTTSGTNAALDLVISQQLHVQSATEQVMTPGVEQQAEALTSCFKNYEVSGGVVCVVICQSLM